jgi:hypothetical protein
MYGGCIVCRAALKKVKAVTPTPANKILLKALQRQD